jgi:hypothetical protein
MAATYRINENQSACVGLSVHFIHLINSRNVVHIKLVCFCVFVKYSPQQIWLKYKLKLRECYRDFM